MLADDLQSARLLASLPVLYGVFRNVVSVKSQTTKFVCR